MSWIFWTLIGLVVGAAIFIGGIFTALWLMAKFETFHDEADKKWRDGHA